MLKVRHKTCIGGVTKVELLDRLRSAGVSINPIGMQLFENESFLTLDSPMTVESVQVSVRELGLPQGGLWAQIVDAAARHDLTLCPLELGPHLRLNLLDQEEGAVGAAETKHQAPPGAITIASAPLGEDDDVPKGFYLRRIEGTLWLRGYKSWPGHVWQPQNVLVFACKRDASS